MYGTERKPARPVTLAIDLKEDIVPFTTFRASLSKFMEQARRTHRPVVVTQNGKSSSVLLDIDAFEAMQEEMEIRRMVDRTLDDVRAGRTIPQAEAKARIMAKFRK